MTSKDKLQLQAALNGDRDHPALPRTPKELATEARQAVEAGAQSLHLHPYDKNGHESLESGVVATALQAVRVECPRIPISLSTSAGIEPDPNKRNKFISSWTERPDLVTVNMGEEGILGLCDLLVKQNIEIEAGLLSYDDALNFVDLEIAPMCRRAMVEPLKADPDEAVALAAKIEQLLTDNDIQIEQIHHGDKIASWAVNRRAAELGHGIRTGLEDTPVLPDGRLATGNGELVAAAADLLK